MEYKAKKANQVKGEQLKKIDKKFHKTLPILHVLSNREMTELDGGQSEAKKHERLGSITWTLGCPRQ